MTAYNVTFSATWHRGANVVFGRITVRVLLDRANDPHFATATACADIEPLRLTITGVSVQEES